MHRFDSTAERISAFPEGDRISGINAIDLSDPHRKSSESAAELQQEKDLSFTTSAKLAQIRTTLISALFEKASHTQDTHVATELLEEARLWEEDLTKEQEFIRNYREETGDETAFSESYTQLIKADKALKSELNHMLEVVRIWHEDDPTTGLAEIVDDETEGVFEDVNDKDLIIDEAPEAETMLTSTTEQESHEASPVEATHLPSGYHEVPANDASEETENELEALSPDEERIIASPIISIEQKDTDEYLRKAETSPMIVIPNDFEATEKKYTALNRQIKDIEALLSRNTRYADREAFDDVLIDLSKQYIAFHERLDILNQGVQDADNAAEEKELIANAIHHIEDIRHRIHEMKFISETPGEVQAEKNLGLKTVKKEKLESIAERLASAIERSGIKHPELYMVEQSSGLGSVRRGLMKLFGKKESIINKATLTKLKNEALQVEQNYLQAAYSEAERNIGPYAKNSLSKILALKDTEDIHEFWNTIHAEIEDLNNQLEIAPVSDTGKGEAKVKGNKAKEDERTYEAERTIGRNQREAARQAKETYAPAKLRHADDLIEAIKKDKNVDSLTFLPEDYTDALAELRYAINTDDLRRIQMALPRVQSMKEEISGLYIDMTNADGQPILEDEAYINKAFKILEKNHALIVPKKKGK